VHVLGFVHRAGFDVTSRTASTRAAWAAVALAVGTFCDSHVAFAQDATLALYVEGPDAPAVREVVRDALPGGVTLASEDAFRTEFVREGQADPLGKDLDPAVIERVRRAARILGVAAVVVVRVRLDAATHRALVLVVPAWKTPATAEETDLTLASHDADVAAIAAVVRPTLQSVLEPAPQPASPSLGGDRPSLPASPGPSATRSTPAQIAATSELEVTAGPALMGRHYDYKDGIDPSALRYTLSPSLATSIGGQVFPLPRADGAWRDLGLTADYLRIYSPMNDASSVAEALFASSYDFGLRARIHPGIDPRLILGVSLSYAFASFESLGPAQFELPNVTYRSVRPEVDGRIAFGPFALVEAFAFHVLLDTGGISTRFYAPHGYGLDAAVGGVLSLTRLLEVKLTVDYTIVSLLFDLPAGANFAEGGVRDQLYGATLALGLVL
jgi:hypothetical protein